jgi:hypothetical protein
MSGTNSPSPVVHDEGAHVAHPKRALALIALVIVTVLAGGYGLRAMENNRPRPPNPPGMPQHVQSPAQPP